MDVEDLIEECIERTGYGYSAYDELATAIRYALTELAATHAIELRAYEVTVANQAERIRQLDAALEAERIRLAVCGVIAMANTPETAAKAREMRSEYWSASAQDCANAVDREMALQDRIRQLEAERVPEGWSITRQGDWISIIQPDKKGVKLRLNQTNHHGADATLYRLADTLLAAAQQPKKEGE